MGAAEVAAVLAPLVIPFLKRAGAEAQGQLADMIGHEAAQSVAGLWGRLRARLGGEDVEPSEESVQSRLTDVLTDDPQLLEEARTTVRIAVEGNRNVVQQGRTNINITGGRNIDIGRLPD